jgi:hypothetical protein
LHPMCCAACRYSISDLYANGRRMFPSHGGNEAAYGGFGACS